MRSDLRSEADHASRLRGKDMNQRSWHSITGVEDSLRSLRTNSLGMRVALDGLGGRGEGEVGGWRGDFPGAPLGAAVAWPWLRSRAWWATQGSPERWLRRSRPA